ncbi:hypothetical protein PLICBS_008833 [Purpureocillium lilacinum]|uniref:uncharacterized protein n=1 Tax=Purpureocillium lilacinum TaxID=33203 RepID=UPI00207F7AF6|nr:hypothetical protein PLICBS_008833 [Purpureocillium lilacinum]
MIHPYHTPKMMSKDPFDVFRHDPTADNLKECIRQGGHINQVNNNGESAIEYATLRYHDARVSNDTAEMEKWKALITVLFENNATVHWRTVAEPEGDYQTWMRQLVHNELTMILGFQPV